MEKVDKTATYKIHCITLKIFFLCKSGKTLPYFGCFHFHHFWATYVLTTWFYESPIPNFLLFVVVFSSKHIQKSRIRCGEQFNYFQDSKKQLRNFEHLNSEVSCFSFRILFTLILKVFNRNWAVICCFWSESW